MEHKNFADSWTVAQAWPGGFGTLLGPEETPGGVFLVAAPGLDRLTPAGGGGGGRVGWGVVVC